MELVPKIVSFPVSMKTKDHVAMSATYDNPVELKPGESVTTFNSFVSVHEGDCFRTLRSYSDFMVRQGVQFKEAPKGAYEPVWCGWGYGEDFTLQEFYGTFPKVKKLGLKWIVLDDGWHSGLGDFNPQKNKFPRGDAGMKALVDSIHSIGAKAELWWNPLAVFPSTDMFEQHPQNLLLNKDGSPRYIQYLELLLSLSVVRCGTGRRARLCDQSVERMGVRRLKDRRQQPELRAAVLQLRTPPCASGGIDGSAAGVF